MDALEIGGLALAAFAAGSVNAVAGGGSLITFPALLAAGYPAKTANVTSTVALWPGYLGGSLGYRSELRGQGRRVLLLLPATACGGVAGAALLLWTPGNAFETIVPFLILLAVALMLFQDRLAAFAEAHQHRSQHVNQIPWLLQGSMFLLGIYGAYFGAALGIMTLAAYAVLLNEDIQRSNALKGLTSLIINAVAVVYFVAFGPVEWAAAAIMAGAALVGGYLGVGLARRLGAVWLRRAVVVLGVTVAIIMFARL